MSSHPQQGKFKSFLFAGVSLFSLVLFSNVSANEIKVGDLAPDFSLMNQDGTEVKLADYRDQWVVLYFYPKNDTPGCTTEACSFRDNINRLIAQQAVVLGVSLDSAASHAKFAAKYNLPFDLLSDETGKATEQYGALTNLVVVKFAKRHSFIINPEGKLAKIYRSVDPDTHVREVMDDLKQLQALYLKQS